MLYTITYRLILSVMLIYLSGCVCNIRYKDANDSTSFGDSILRLNAYVSYYLDDEMDIELDIKKENLLIGKPVITVFFPSGDTLHSTISKYDDHLLYGCTNFKRILRKNDRLVVNVKYRYYLNDKIISRDSTFLLYKDEDCEFSLRLH